MYNENYKSREKLIENLERKYEKIKDNSGTVLIVINGNEVESNINNCNVIDCLGAIDGIIQNLLNREEEGSGKEFLKLAISSSLEIIKKENL